MNAPDITSPEYLSYLERFNAYNMRLTLITFGVLGIPRSFLDLGCGTGACVVVADRLGVPSVGIDKLIVRQHAENKIEMLRYGDLEKPLDIGAQFDMVFCLEVAEHIDKKAVPAFVANVAGTVKDGGYLIWTSAGPGQGGDQHKFLRGGYWWRDRLHEHGVHYREDVTWQLKLAWTAIKMPMMWLPSNLQVFDR